uniref:RNA helicase n=1 Tax=Alexandrium catenella TaxID=2925 RepID=A0A7S1SAT0_ALECA|mmetsp:Transcript_93557/g.248348  ORF Transcript_93557/g.248348 Transcript_93557/m.248348 type:complete len:444 (+) Transcript_93557:2-1333(+)
MECTSPMPIQAQALPIVLGGHDLVGIAKTGSGKTLAYLLPAIVHIEAQRPMTKGIVTPIALIMAPTRELAVQIYEVAYKLVYQSKEGNQPGGIWSAVVYGGKQKGEQAKNLWRGCHILVATPGRLMDFVQNEEISLGRVTYFVLDEADRMLDCGFQDDVYKIASAIRPDRHMLFFSATWPKEVQDLAQTLCQDGQQPVRISVGQHEDGVQATRADITQEVVVFDQDTWEERDNAKRTHLYAHLRSVLQTEENKILVFVNSKNMADEMRNRLYEEGFKTESMHGGRPQQTRLDVLAGFRRGETRLLVATDVMGRGLDIPDISHVVLYDMGAVDDYIHRIGRTARGLTGGHSGLGGHALTLFEYNNKWPEIPGGLCQVLSEAGQEVPIELQAIADEVASGLRRTVERGDSYKKRKWKSGDWNETGGEWHEEWQPGWTSGGWQAWN